jgi:hypothetical protein
MNKQEKGRSLILQSALTLGLMILPLLITQSYAGPKIMDPFESNQFTHTDVPPDISGDPCQVTSQHYLNKDLPNDEIVKLFEKIAKGGDVRGTLWMARLYHKGRCSLPMQPDTAQKMAKEVIGDIMDLADEGDSEAQFLLASAYEDGLAVTQDCEQAVYWYTKSAIAWNLGAMCNLSIMYLYAHGVEPNVVKARNLMDRLLLAGSKPFSRKMSAVRDDGRDDTQRLATLRSVPLVQALGMQREKGIAFLVEQNLIADPTGYKESMCNNGRKQFFFANQGIILLTDPVNDRIVSVEGYVKESGVNNSYTGSIPFGLDWNATANSVRKTLGMPDDTEDRPTDQAYGMAYRIENVFFAVMFSYEEEKKLKIWRVHEKWAAKYPTP